MMTKSQIIEKILEIEDIDTKSNLMKKSLTDLNSILSEIQGENSQENSGKNLKDVSIDSDIDKEKLLEELKAQILEELREKAIEEAKEVLLKDSKKEEKMRVDETNRFQTVPVMNITNGILVYSSKRTGAEWVFSNYGDIEYIELQELISMKSGARRFFDEPFILILDDEIVEFLGLSKLYEKFKNPDQIDKIFKMSQEDFQEVVEKSPKGIQNLIASRANKLYKEGKLDSVRKTNYINEKFKMDIGERGR